MVETFMTWYGGLETMLQFYWACAIISSVLFLVQMVLMITGMDFSDVDIDLDMSDTDTGFSLVSIKSLITFFLGLGWAGVSFWHLVPNKVWLGLLAVLVGFVCMLLFFFALKQVLKLEHEGNYNPSDCVGKVADVYVPIPGEKSGNGKVQLSLNGSVLEFAAQTEGARLVTGCKVRVCGLLDNDTLMVESV
ncbi:MAG: hypothetical protein NC388_03905 [Clostridium sp.]|nr:hypothetical protein [Clostridium sp.]